MSIQYPHQPRVERGIRYRRCGIQTLGFLVRALERLDQHAHSGAQGLQRGVVAQQQRVRVAQYVGQSGQREHGDLLVGGLKR